MIFKRIAYRVSRIGYKIRHPFSAIRNTKYTIRPESSGFTLVEMIVAVGLFAVVMLVCVGALLALVGANRKVHALQSVMNNVNITVDGMVRAIRMGSSFDASGACVNGNPGGGARDCTQGGTMFAFQPYGNTGTSQPWVYRLQNGRIERSTNGGAFMAVTSADLTIDSLLFYVVGSDRGCSVNPCNLKQPKVVIVIRGTAPVANAKARTTFHLQVTAVQRLLDL